MAGASIRRVPNVCFRAIPEERVGEAWPSRSASQLAGQRPHAQTSLEKPRSLGIHIDLDLDDLGCIELRRILISELDAQKLHHEAVRFTLDDPVRFADQLAELARGLDVPVDALVENRVVVG